MRCERAYSAFTPSLDHYVVTGEGIKRRFHIQGRERKVQGGCSENDVLPVPASVHHHSVFDSRPAAKRIVRVQPAFRREWPVCTVERYTTAGLAGLAADLFDTEWLGCGDDSGRTDEVLGYLSDRALSFLPKA